jgi:thioredoxin-dependent peroxiredoxin
MALEVGAKAPLFTARTNGDEKLALKDLKGRWVVLYFYPTDDTPTCTTQACEFRDNMKRITKAGATVVGVSPDDVRSHDRFIDKYDLNFSLVADEKRRICEKYDVWKEKNMYGRTYMGVVRTTYLIDPSGRIGEVWSRVRVKGHVDAILGSLAELQP